ncbi:aspartate/glutamate racemase family protein [Nonomuraea sp. NPDC049400]|uniref:aspartate/glutamate racemase family protein n=1 Tax=Nonomuraea sp. NPDC049400 TaxID=3364352 RepID=UPI0037A77062
MTPSPESVLPTLGVLGGMGPAAGAEFLRVFVRLWPARSDQEHPRVLLLSEPDIPDRTEALAGRQPDPTALIRSRLLLLNEWGANLLAVPCNTAFAFIDRFSHELPVPVVHPVRAAIAAASRRAPEGAWLMATDGTVACGLYQKHAAEQEYDLLIPDSSAQAAVQRSLRAVKAGDLAEAARSLTIAVGALRATRPLPFLLGCTELSLAWQAAGDPGVAVDSLNVLAAECVRRLTPLTRRAGSAQRSLRRREAAG